MTESSLLPSRNTVYNDWQSYNRSVSSSTLKCESSVFMSLCSEDHFEKAPHQVSAGGKPEQNLCDDLDCFIVNKLTIQLFIFTCFTSAQAWNSYFIVAHKQCLLTRLTGIPVLLRWDVNRIIFYDCKVAWQYNGQNIDGFSDLAGLDVVWTVTPLTPS